MSMEQRQNFTDRGNRSIVRESFQVPFKQAFFQYFLYKISCIYLGVIQDRTVIYHRSIFGAMIEEFY